MEIIAHNKPMTFKELEKHERDSLFEHWVSLAKEFYKNNENKQKFIEWKNQKDEKRPAA